MFTKLPIMYSGCQKMLDSLPSQNLPDITASIVKASYAEKIQVLDAVDLRERFKKTLPLLMRQIEAILVFYVVCLLPANQFRCAV